MKRVALLALLLSASAIAMGPDDDGTQFTRDADYVGGTNGHTNYSLRSFTNVHPGARTFEWNGLFELDNNSVAADGSENVALYAQARKNATGATWAGVFELRDAAVDPERSSVATEIDLMANGGDNYSNRVMMDFVTGKRDPAGAAPTIGYGIRMQAQGGNRNNAYIRWVRIFALLWLLRLRVGSLSTHSSSASCSARSASSLP